MSRLRLVGLALAVGLVVGAAGLLSAVVALGSVRAASDTVFLLGALAFGFGLLGWSGSILAANSVEAMQDQLDAASGWTETNSRRAMARIGSFGFGVMVGSAVATVVVGGV
ncbi:hypothetical protein SAMN04487948_108128 [Halogranum amylolyticum]|uniref:Uncharacterized protein n=1 Tax=Halogranum amylolyticum TaxID=660520 RepID=A0A1H8TTW9_9EURY|nr:hypothetical protein [Halogranum amylolyticum]SEO94470.1 hypothetical protein SAMN04487948_108128 [Halogranum amylolyticum]